MRVVFFGTPLFAVPTLNKLIENPDTEVLAVVTQPDKRRGRGNRLTPSPVKEVALEHDIPVWQPKSVKKNAKTLESLKNAGADFFVVIAYGQLLSKEILEMPRYGCINVHGSILPKYRGAAPIQWAIARGETETGITTMLMDEGMDTGDMLLKTFIPIDLFDNAGEVAKRLADSGGDLLLKTLIGLSKGEITPEKQDNSLANYAPLLDKSDFEIDWHLSAKEIHDRVRGFHPNAVTTFRGETIKILATVPLDDNYQNLLPVGLRDVETGNLSGSGGEIAGIVKNFGPIVATGRGWLLLKEVQLSGKRPATGKDFVNGSRLNVGEFFGS